MHDIVTKEIVIEDATKVFMVSDPHFDHTNIIEYCNRPFASIGEMNIIILDNWLKAIKSDDIVLFLGDMCFGRGARKARWWLDQLTGKIIYIKGSHDQGIRPTSVGLNAAFVADVLIVAVNGLKLTMMHNPTGRTDWNTWLVHGHTHNELPFISHKHKRVNVSLDVTEFKPVRLDVICTIIQEGVNA